MTLNVQYSWQDYTTDGVQTVFPYPFYVKEKLDLTAYWEQLGTPPWHPGQPVTTPLPSAFYTLTGLGQPSGGTLVTQTPLPQGRLVLRRSTPQNQLTDYLEGDAFPADSHETALDRLTVLVQDHQEVLSRASVLRVETGTPHRGLTLPDPQPNTVLGWDSLAEQWTLYPSGVTAIPFDVVSGIGRGRNTIALEPEAGATQATGLVFPTGVLALAVTVWVETTIGQSQGLTHVGIGTPALPDCWGRLSAVSAGTVSTAGMFQGYGSQPQPATGQVTLSAYGGLFDGTGRVYVTGHFQTFTPSHALGYTFDPGVETPGTPVPGVPAASETQAGILEVATTAETTTGTDDSRAVTPLKLQQRLDTYSTTLPQATETLRGAVELATTAEVTTGTDDARAVTPLKLAGRLAALPSASETVPGLVELATSAETTTGTDATRAVTPAGLAAKVPSGTPLSVPRYAAAGTALESSPVTIDASGNVLVGTPSPGTSLTKGLVMGSGTAPTTSPADAVQLWSADMSGIGGKACLHLRTENAIHHVLGEQVGLGTLLTASPLGSGENYRRLNVQGAQIFVGQSSLQERPQALLVPSWVVSTDATRTARLTLSVHDATAAREGLRLEADGSAARLGFYGAAAVAKPTVTGSRGGNAALASVLTALGSLGLVTDSSTA